METYQEELDAQIAYEVAYLRDFEPRKGWSKDYTEGYIDGLKQAMSIWQYGLDLEGVKK